MKYDKAYIEEFLTEDNCSIEDYFIVEGLIMYMADLCGKQTPMAFVIEEDSLAEACIDFLKEKNVKEYKSLDEIEY